MITERPLLIRIPSLLDVPANRVTMGVITGDVRFRSKSFRLFISQLTRLCPPRFLLPGILRDDSFQVSTNCEPDIVLTPTDSSCHVLLSLDFCFQRKTGYVQQQDLHLETATVVSGLSSRIPCFSRRATDPG
jgi:hypothetical protein